MWDHLQNKLQEVARNVHEKEWKNETEVTKHSVPILFLDLNSKIYLAKFLFKSKKVTQSQLTATGCFPQNQLIVYVISKTAVLILFFEYVRSKESLHHVHVRLKYTASPTDMWTLSRLHWWNTSQTHHRRWRALPNIWFPKCVCLRLTSIHWNHCREEPLTLRAYNSKWPPWIIYEGGGKKGGMLAFPHD